MVNALIVSKLAKGLFTRAICTGGTILKPQFFMSRSYASDLFDFLVRNILNYNGPKDGKKMKEFLKTIPTEKIIEIMPIHISLGIVIDGYVIPDDPTTLFEKNRQPKVPILLGCVPNEGFDFIQPFIGHAGNTVRDENHFNELVSALIKLYTFKNNGEGVQNEMVMKTKNFYNSKNKRPELLYRLASKMMGDVYTVCPTYKLAECYAKKGAPVYLYELHHQPSFCLGPPWLIMSRGMDVPFIFGDPFLSRVLTSWKQADKSISMDLMKAWGEFADKG